MDEKIDFKAFKQEAEVQQFLESQLPIRIATPIDVFSVLGKQDLRHSGYVDQASLPSFLHPLPFEHHIFAHTPADNSIFPAQWRIHFGFEQYKLAHIEVSKTPWSLLPTKRIWTGSITRKINYKRFGREAEVQIFFEAQFAIGSATPIDVFSFLGEQDLWHSWYVDNRKWANSAAPLPFEYHISVGAPAKRVGLLFPAIWVIDFYFEKDKLAQISVRKSADGI